MGECVLSLIVWTFHSLQTLMCVCLSVICMYADKQQTNATREFYLIKIQLNKRVSFSSFSSSCCNLTISNLLTQVAELLLSFFPPPFCHIIAQKHTQKEGKRHHEQLYTQRNCN